MTNSEAIKCLCIPYKADKTLSIRGYCELAFHLNENGRQPFQIQENETWEDVENGIVPIGKLVNEQRLSEIRTLEKLLMKCGTLLSTRADRESYPSRFFHSENRPPVVYGRKTGKGLQWSSGWDPKRSDFVTGHLSDAARLRSKGYVCVSVTGVLPAEGRVSVYNKFIPDPELYEAYKEATLDESPFAMSVRRHFAADYRKENLNGDPETDVWALCALTGGSKVALVGTEPLSDDCPRRLCASYLSGIGLKVPELTFDTENTDEDRFVHLLCYAFDGTEVLD